MQRTYPRAWIGEEDQEEDQTRWLYHLIEKRQTEKSHYSSQKACHQVGNFEEDDRYEFQGTMYRLASDDA